jgi:hypothetical protein
MTAHARTGMLPPGAGINRQGRSAPVTAPSGTQRLTYGYGATPEQTGGKQRCGPKSRRGGQATAVPHNGRLCPLHMTIVPDIGAGCFPNMPAKGFPLSACKPRRTGTSWASRAPSFELASRATPER